MYYVCNTKVKAIDMKYYPIVIPTMNRVSHLQRLLESLQKNKLAQYTEVYISVDYPPFEKYFSGYHEMCAFLKEEICGFGGVHVFYQEKNLGPSANAEFLFNVVKQKYDAYIYSEDDNIFSPNFLEYMDVCLEKYRSDESVVAVSGYLWPIEVEQTNSIKGCDSLFSAWGYGTWFNKEKELLKGLSFDSFERMLHNSRIVYKLKSENPFIFSELIKGYFEYSGCLVKNGDLRPIDLAYSVLMFWDNKRTIYPSCSKVRNGGNDGSGVNCVNLANDKSGKTNRDFDYSLQLIDESNSFDFKDSDFSNIEMIDSKLKKFMDVPKKELMKCDCLYVFYRIFGRDKCVALIHKMK